MTYHFDDALFALYVKQGYARAGSQGVRDRRGGGEHKIIRPTPKTPAERARFNAIKAAAKLGLCNIAH